MLGAQVLVAGLLLVEHLAALAQVKVRLQGGADCGNSMGAGAHCWTMHCNDSACTTIPASKQNCAKLAKLFCCSTFAASYMEWCAKQTI